MSHSAVITLHSVHCLFHTSDDAQAAFFYSELNFIGGRLIKLSKHPSFPLDVFAFLLQKLQYFQSEDRSAGL